MGKKIEDLRPRLGLLTALEAQLNVEQVLKERHWNNAVTVSEENPYPLAPADMVRKREVDQDSYERWTYLFTRDCKGIMLPEIPIIAGEPGFPKGPRGLVVGGAGLLRDLEEWLEEAQASQFSTITIVDCSSKPCDKALEFIEKHSLVSAKVLYKELEDAWDDGSIDDRNTLMYYCGQFVQNQDRAAKDRMLEHFGRFLRMETIPGVLGRRVYLLHPLGEENPYDLVEWNNTVPYTLQELHDPLKKGFDGPVLMKVIGKHHFFGHQWYTFFRISADPKFFRISSRLEADAA
jgi:hypothetical protein